MAMVIIKIIKTLFSYDASLTIVNLP